MTRRYAGLVIALLLLAGCTTNQQGIPALNPTTGPADAVARITYRDGSTEYISQSTLDQFRTEVYGSPQQPAPAGPVLDELLSRQLLLRQARNTDIVADPQQVEQTIENIRSNPRACGSRVQEPMPGPGEDQQSYFDKCAQAFGFENGNAFRNFVAEELTVERMAREGAEKDQIRAAHILWTAKEDPQQSEADYARALQTHVELCGSQGSSTQPVDLRCSDDINFQALARRLSEEPGARESGGELPPFNAQGLTDEQQPFDTTFVSQTFALRDEFVREGVAISEPFETQFGWHIVKILELTASAEATQNYRNAVLERAKAASLEDLQQPNTGNVPLVGVVEILRPLPSEAPIPTPEPLVIETPTPEATSAVPADATVTPVEETSVPAEETTTPTP